MIQPVSAFSSRAEFRGSSRTYGKQSKGQKNSNIALINTGGASLATGALTAAIARGYTSSWGHAIVLGLCGTFLAMFFMTPQLISKTAFRKFCKTEPDAAIKPESPRALETITEHLKPAKKMVQFKQQS